MTYSLSFVEETNKTPQFLIKLYEILESTDFTSIISWSDSGDHFIIKNLSLFSDKILAKYFKHQNFSSFVRQLNMYDFHKIKHSSNEHCFEHPYFKKNLISQFKYIKRKTIKNKKYKSKVIKRKVDIAIPSISLEELNNKVTNLEKNYSHLSENYKSIKNENEELKEKLKEKEKNIDSMMNIISDCQKNNLSFFKEENEIRQMNDLQIFNTLQQQIINLVNITRNIQVQCPFLTQKITSTNTNIQVNNNNMINEALSNINNISCIILSNEMKKNSGFNHKNPSNDR